MAELRFDGRVAVVTGAGAGLGRAYALLFASRGASVVVNDLGGGRHGDGKSSSAADAVVQEIRSKGGKAVADYNNVVEGEKIIETALANFGRVDILVNNAGILRDKSFPRISAQDWDLIMDVHLKGAFKCTQAAWPHMQKQNYGRVIMTSSNSGMYGNFGQANYSAAKMGLAGLANTLAIEGRKKNINVNVILPTAASRLTEDIMPPDFLAELKPELIAPVVVWLCHEKCQDTGSYIEAAAGWAGKVHLVKNEGAPLRVKISEGVTPEAVMKKWDQVTDMSEARHYDSIAEASGNLYGVLDKMKENELSSNSNQPQIVSKFEVTNKAAVLFALGVGTDLREPSNLKYLYEMHDDFSALPCFAYIPSTVAVLTSNIMDGAMPNNMEVDPTKFLHGEEYVELYKPFPTSGVLTSRVTLADVLDKGKGAVMLIDVDTFDESGEKVAYTQMAGFIVGAGGFGGKRDSPKAKPTAERPRRSPDFSVKEKVHHNQAALYRLSGDPNPLHVDPNFAQLSGFDKPILHGLCSLGISTKLVLFVYGDNNPSYCKAFKARFAKPVYPGETLKVDMWREGSRVHFETSVVESGNVVISGAYMDLSKVCQPVAPNFVAAALASDPIFHAIKDGIESNKQKAKAVNGVFQWTITKGGKQEAQWVMDLKKGILYSGDPEQGTKVDTFLTIDDNDMVDMSTGKLNPQTAFMKGKLKIKGNLMLTQKLKSVLPSDSKL